MWLAFLKSRHMLGVYIWTLSDVDLGKDASENRESVEADCDE